MKISASQKIAELAASNYNILQLLDHLDIPLVVKEKTVDEVCKEQGISTELFLTFAHLYQGETVPASPDFTPDDLRVILTYLANCHKYYLEQKIPAIQHLVREINKTDPNAGKLLSDFLGNYTTEITEHFNYENNTLFPYIQSLLEEGKTEAYCVDDYKHHHDNINESLADVKKLLIKYLNFNDPNKLRMELLSALFELEYDLTIHTHIENGILIPLIEKFESQLASPQHLHTVHSKELSTPLSLREIDVLRLLLEGLSNKEVADKLCLSTHTVISHRKNISTKTGIKSLAGLTIYAITNGIISVNDPSTLK